MIYAAEKFDFPKVPFVFMRHGETDANRAGIIAGSSEPPLNQAGRHQAIAIAPLMAQGKWQTVFVSPQDRARKTAQLALPGYQPRVLDGLRERHWGDLEGRPISEVCSRFDTPPNGEGFDAMCQRVSFAMQQALAEVTDNLCVIVAHSGVARCILYMTGFEADGPRIANATPMLFRPTTTGWDYENLTETLIKEISA
ncbi:histidine phosphatase family protein [Thalassospira lucentensis]|uniref:histidine phosphatase family protein n=1 Tax=Thalassospira lucentensis TaxID=168935 RepID=UPI003AA91BD9|tara:strand:+ start:7063 stop:7653 length:591 start_codon:yes stop_codon:yes gene_type:complete